MQPPLRVTAQPPTVDDHSLIGTRVGDYTIDRRCSHEDAIVVCEATHLVLPRKAHLKLLTSSARPSAVALLREACLLEALQHPGIPRVYECGVLPDRRPWVALQRIDGLSLQASLGGGPLPILDLVILLRDVADVLAHAHARGVVHERVSVETIIRTPERKLSACLRGWGGARTVDSTQSLEVRDDVYALGTVAFRALTGCLYNPSVSATDWCPAAPPELTALIDVMLDDNARVRPTSEEVRERASWLATTIEPFEIGRPRWTPPNGLDPDTHQVRTTSSTFSIRIGRTITK